MAENNRSETTAPETTVLITGASGYLGSMVAARYRRAGAQVLLHGRRVGQIRPDGTTMAENTAAKTGTAALAPVVVVGDLTDDHPFAAMPAHWRARITHIVHAGAITRFDVDQDLARAVNVDGTIKTLDLAQNCPNLNSFGLVSTVYSTGLRAGPIDEVLYDDGPGFANHYEWSKWQAEQVVGSCGAGLPWRILRVATVIAENTTGRVTQHNAFHETLKLWFHGLLPLVPGGANTPLYLVTGNFVADAAVVLMEPQQPGGIYHLAHDVADAPTLSETIDVVTGAFESVEAFRRRRILPPLLGDEASFALLASGVEAFGGGMVRQALQSVVPFARQLFVAKQLSTRQLRRALGETALGETAALGETETPVPATELVRRTCHWLVATRWGRDAGNSP